MEPRTSCTLSTHSTTDLHPPPTTPFKIRFALSIFTLLCFAQDLSRKTSLMQHQVVYFGWNVFACVCPSGLGRSFPESYAEGERASSIWKPQGPHLSKEGNRRGAQASPNLRFMSSQGCKPWRSSQSVELTSHHSVWCIISGDIWQATDTKFKNDFAKQN